VTVQAETGVWLAQLRAQHGIDGTYDATRTWPFRMGPLTLPVPNFSWRRAAIQRHDLHHILNGFPFNMRGEFQVATWEFAAGRYPHAGASLLLLPLVVLGILWSPRAIWRAFMKGRRSTSLYRPQLLALELKELQQDVRQAVERPGDRRVQAADIAAFAALLLQSGFVVALPLALTALGIALL
jgi:hypothetical protein